MVERIERIFLPKKHFMSPRVSPEIFQAKQLIWNNKLLSLYMLLSYLKPVKLAMYEIKIIICCKS